MGRTPWQTNSALVADIDKLPHGPAWKVYEISTILPDQSVKQSYLFARDIVEVALDLVANPAFSKFMHYVPERLWTTEDCRSRVYDNPWTGDWWWRIQVSWDFCLSVLGNRLTRRRRAFETDMGQLSP